ncbi:toxin-activating lysine-acyltransferase, partial [Pectobacterium odoriferum]|uniref:toxin-activating lysine-acyltransferase n=1 Tax=Pectobacterium odoriferum TaxID=78398 RepID=UPI00215603F0
MKIPVNGYQLTAPLLGGQFSEAEALGAAVWLWMHSAQHRDIPLSVLPTLLLPAIKHQQFVIASRDDKPLFC